MCGKMLVILCTVMILVLFIEAKGEKCDNLGVLLYEDIGCKPLKDKPEYLCPSSYDCSHLQEKGNHCYFQGQKYKNNEQLPGNATIGTCNGGCFCQAEDLLASKFTCAIFDCPEFIGGSPLKNKDCIRTYELDGCCASGQICPPFDKIETCKVDGLTYKEGQKFSPKGFCNACLCQKGYAGKFEAPFCKREICGVEIRHSEDVKNNCAPVYPEKEVRCCPYHWVCSSESDVFSPAEKNAASVKTCKFGNKEIKSGQVLKRNLEEYGQKFEVKCDCQIPPLLTCVIQK